MVDVSRRRIASSSASSKIQTPWRILAGVPRAEVDRAVAVKPLPRERGERGALPDALAAFEDEHRVDLAARLHRAGDARQEPLPGDAPDQIRLVGSLRHDGAVVLEPPIDARDAVPDEPLEVLAHGVKGAAMGHDAHGVDDAVLAEGRSKGLLEPQADCVDVALADGLADAPSSPNGGGERNTMRWLSSLMPSTPAHAGWCASTSTTPARVLLAARGGRGDGSRTRIRLAFVMFTSWKKGPRSGRRWTSRSRLARRRHEAGERMHARRTAGRLRSRDR